MSVWQPSISGYDGLASLLAAAKARQVDWDKISLSHISSQVRTALASGTVDMGEGSALVADLAELLELKTTSLLPRAPEPENPEDEDDFAETMLARLMDYRSYQMASLAMEDLSLKQEERFGRLPPEILAWEKSLLDVEGISLEHLVEILAGLLEKAGDVGDGAGWVLEREQLPLPAIMDWLEGHLGALGGSVDLPSVFPTGQGRPYIVATFLALLELVRVGRVSLSRNGESGLISVYLGGTTGD